MNNFYKIGPEASFAFREVDTGNHIRGKSMDSRPEKV